MKIELDHSISEIYKNKCLEHLKGDIGIGEYTDMTIIKKALKMSLEYLSYEFEVECEKLNSISDVSFFLEMYSRLSNNEESKSEENIIFKKVCKAVFGELTKLNIISDNNCHINSTLISNLYSLIELIDYYTQELCCLYIVDTINYKLDLSSNSFKLLITNENEANELKKFKTKFNQLNYIETCVSENEMPIFIEVIQSAFGEPSKKLHDILYIGNRFNVISVKHIVELEPDYYSKGLILQKSNVDLLQSIHKPQKMIRSRFRPILKVNINNTIDYITTPIVFFEALSEYVTNQIPFGLLPEEWKNDSIMKQYAKEQKEKHGKWLEDKVELLLMNEGYIYRRNLKNINKFKLDKEKTIVDNKYVGEIDYIIIDSLSKIVYVVDCKFMKTKYNYLDFSSDMQSYTNKKNGYNNKLTYKLEWVTNHLNDVQTELEIDDNISEYDTKAFFITNSFTFCSLFSFYPIIPFQDLMKFLNGGMCNE